MGGFLLINPRSGKGRPDASELRRKAEQLGITTHVLGPDDDAGELAREAAGPLGVAGGDGSLAPVADVAIERDVPFVVVPFGTRNHFARDVGLDPDDPLGALRAFSGRDLRVDAGRVNDRLFLNNVSLGLYARLVHRRERHRRRREAFARLRALGILLRRPSSLGVTIDGRPVAARVVVVANNHYKDREFRLLQLIGAGLLIAVLERSRLDDRKRSQSDNRAAQYQSLVFAGTRHGVPD